MRPSSKPSLRRIAPLAVLSFTVLPACPEPAQPNDGMDAPVDTSPVADAGDACSPLHNPDGGLIVTVCPGPPGSDCATLIYPDGAVTLGFC